MTLSSKAHHALTRITILPPRDDNVSSLCKPNLQIPLRFPAFAHDVQQLCINTHPVSEPDYNIVK